MKRQVCDSLFFFFSVSVEIKNAETNEDAAGVWLEVVSLFFFPSPYCVCGVVFFSVADIIKLRMVQVVVENKKKKRRKRSSSDNHAGIILISSVTNLRELLFPPLFVFAFFFFCVCVVVFVPLLPWNTTCGILYAQQQLRLVAWKQSEKRKITPHFCGAKLYSCQKMVSLRLSGPVVKVSCHFWKAQNTLYHNERFSALIGLTREDSNARACWVG